MNTELLTTARWHALNTPMPWGSDVNDAVIELLGDKLGYAAPDAPDEPIAPLPRAGSPALVVLCLGHARPIDEGNVGYGGISEEDYNRPILDEVAELLETSGVECEIIDEYPHAGYGASMRWLAAELKRRGATAAVEFHFNAANKKARGHEVLHWEHSVRGKTLAKSLLDAFDEAFPNQPSRGLKPRNHRDRGALFLSLLHCPSVIAEPFFGDQATDWAKFSTAKGMADLARAYAMGIGRWVRDQEEGGEA